MPKTTEPLETTLEVGTRKWFFLCWSYRSKYYNPWNLIYCNCHILKSLVTGTGADPAWVAPLSAWKSSLLYPMEMEVPQDKSSLVQKQSNMTTACRSCSQPATWTPEIQLKEKREQRTAMLCNMAMHNERWRSVGKDWNEKEGGITSVLLIRAAHC